MEVPSSDEELVHFLQDMEAAADPGEVPNFEKLSAAFHAAKKDKAIEQELGKANVAVKMERQDEADEHATEAHKIFSSYKDMEVEDDLMDKAKDWRKEQQPPWKETGEATSAAAAVAAYEEAPYDAPWRKEPKKDAAWKGQKSTSIGRAKLGLLEILGRGKSGCKPRWIN